MVSVDNNLILGLIGNPTATASFGFLRTAKIIFDSQRTSAVEKSCRKCDKDTTAAVVKSVYQSIKKALANMTPGQQVRFKELIGVPQTEKVQVIYKVGLKTKTVEF